MDTGVLVVFAGVLVGFGCLGLLVQEVASRKSRHMRRRADGVRRRWQGTPESASEVDVRRHENSAIPTVDRMAKRYLPRQSVLKARLARTGRDISMGSYVAVSAALVVAIGVTGVVVFGASPVVGVLAGVAVGIGIPHFVVGRLGARRAKAFVEVFPDAIDLIVRGLRSGLPVSESMATVGREMPDPVGHEFRVIADGIRIGRTLDEALWEAAARLDMAEFKFFVISLSVQRETGGNLGETLANLSDILRRRRQMRLKIRAMSSEARASAYILGSLPFLMFGILLVLNHDYTMTLFNDPRGLAMVGVGATSLLIGIGVMAKMVRFEI